MARLVMMEGGAGSGKSTLALSLASEIRESGGDVDLIPEEAIFSRREFAIVGRGFKTKRFASAEQFLDAYRPIFRSARESGSWVIADWSCVGMIEDLPWAQPDGMSTTSGDPEQFPDFDVLEEHARAVAQTAEGLRPVLLVLSISAEDAVDRAARERGHEWVDRYAAMMPAQPDEMPISRVLRRARAFEPRNARIIEAHAAGGWEVAWLDAGHAASEVLAEALAILGA